MHVLFIERKRTRKAWGQKLELYHSIYSIAFSVVQGFNWNNETRMEEKDSKPRESGPVIFDGMVLPPFPPLVQDAKKRFEEIRNMEYRKDDIILAIYPKSGRTIFFKHGAVRLHTLGGQQVIHQI